MYYKFQLRKAIQNIIGAELIVPISKSRKCVRIRIIANTIKRYNSLIHLNHLYSSHKICPNSTLPIYLILSSPNLCFSRFEECL